MEEIFKYPRLYVPEDLSSKQTIALSQAHAHYLKSVLRQNDADTIRLFNGRDGEWVGTLENLSKKAGAVVLKDQTRSQTQEAQSAKLLFAPIKKKRLDILIEKAVELGVSELHPVITERTENRKLNMERMQNQIIEGAEQNERLTIPTLHEPEPLYEKIQNWTTPIIWASERSDNTIPIQKAENPESFLIGPEGGFTPKEAEFLSARTTIQPVSLGTEILRAETAAIYCLSFARLSKT